jgi:hypothetical protein
MSLIRTHFTQQPVVKPAQASLPVFARTLRCRNSAYFVRYSSFLRLDPEQNPRRDTARGFFQGLLEGKSNLIKNDPLYWRVSRGFQIPWHRIKAATS